jgi:LmbE family N-acetylglucosaminyl deacetylase
MRCPAGTKVRGHIAEKKENGIKRIEGGREKEAKKAMKVAGIEEGVYM